MDCPKKADEDFKKKVAEQITKYLNEDEKKELLEIL